MRKLLARLCVEVKPESGIRILTEQASGTGIGQRGTRVDVIVETGDDSILVEMQMRAHAFVPHRAVLYASQEYVTLWNQRQKNDGAPAGAGGSSSSTDILLDASGKPVARTDRGRQYYLPRRVHVVVIAAFNSSHGAAGADNFLVPVAAGLDQSRYAALPADCKPAEGFSADSVTKEFSELCKFTVVQLPGVPNVTGDAAAWAAASPTLRLLSVMQHMRALTDVPEHIKASDPDLLE